MASLPTKPPPSSAPSPAPLTLLSAVTPAAPSRAWLTAPHPYLPLIATASSDKSVRVYSLTSFTLLSTIGGGHKRSVRTCAWKPGARGDASSTLATGSFDASAGIWRGDNERQRVGGATHSASHDDSDDGGGDDGDEEADDDDYHFAVILEGHDSEVKSVAWSAHGTFLATCSRDKSVWVWEAVDEGGPGGDDDNFETVAVLQEHDGDVKCVAWHPADEGCLASASYDETVRVWRDDADGEWSCVGICNGHTGTVWCVAWEPAAAAPLQGGESAAQALLRQVDDTHNDDEPAEVSGPRLVSCSDDLTVRLWRRRPKAPRRPAAGPRIPSIIRSTGDDEEWFEEGRLPQRHDRAIYAVAWSGVSRRIVTCGSDGRIIVYEERGGAGEEAAGEWVVVAEVEGAHGVFEVNHVCWARRYDSGRRGEDDEVVVSTGDDGEVKVWIL